MVSYIPYIIGGILILLAIPILGSSLERIINVCLSVLHYLNNTFQTLVQSAPSFFKTYLFILIIVVLGGGLVSFIISSMYGCTSDNHLKEFKNFGGGFALMLESSLSGNESAEKYDTFLNNPNTTIDKTDTSKYSMDNILRIQCFSATPRLSFLGLNIFSYQLWILLIFCGIVIKVMYR